MDDTDFDVLCEGASTAEAKQLRKLLADWCERLPLVGMPHGAAR